MKQVLIDDYERVLQWIENKIRTCDGLPPLYLSVDIRESNHKIAPVDINLFSSGFNNFSDRIDVIAKQFLGRIESFPRRKVALIAENFTRNIKYLENVSTLKKALEEIYQEVQILTINEGVVIDFTSQKEVDLSTFDLVILNNDLSTGCPEILYQFQDRVLSSPHLGWHTRRKHIHMSIYNNLVSEMIRDCQLPLDPWVLSTLCDHCDGIEFKEKVGIEVLAERVENVLYKINQKYREHSITDCRPHVFIKANNGTFGMGIMVAYSGEDIININKKTRHSMSTLKQGVSNVDIIIQEGIPSNIEFSRATGEEVLYIVGDSLLGKLIRYNDRKSNEQNLNSIGMEITVSNSINPIDHIISGLTRITTQIELSMIGQS